MDMLKCDWLPPVGNGEHADVIFTRNPREGFGTGTNPRGITAPAYRDSMSVKFIGNGNGLVEVATPPTAWLKIRHAPEEGYRQDYVCWKERSKDLSRASNFDAKRNFAFRIRTERDEDGRITSAYYGKIYGDICFKKLVGENVEAVASPCFQYYLNPAPNDRNLEWDMKNNSSQVNFGQGDNVHETPVRQPKAMQEGVCWMQTPFAVASADEYVY